MNDLFPTDSIATIAQGVSFWVPGVPQPQGNKTPFVIPGTKRAVLVEGRRPESREAFKSWRAIVRMAAAQAFGERDPIDGPVELTVSFVFPRPANHFGERKGVRYLKPTAPLWMSTRPDGDKLERAISDAMEGVVYTVDSRIAHVTKEKVYGDRPGAQISVRELRAVGPIA